MVHIIQQLPSFFCTIFSRYTCTCTVCLQYVYTRSKLNWRLIWGYVHVHVRRETATILNMSGFFFLSQLSFHVTSPIIYSYNRSHMTHVIRKNHAFNELEGEYGQLRIIITCTTYVYLFYRDISHRVQWVSLLIDLRSWSSKESHQGTLIKQQSLGFYRAL